MALGMVAAMGAIGPAGAAPAGDRGPSAEKIAVVAPPAIERKVVGRSVHGAPIVDWSVSHPVRYRDLDLSRNADRAELDTRIATAAKEACGQLIAYKPLEFGLSRAGERDCIRQAIRGAEKQKALVLGQS